MRPTTLRSTAFLAAVLLTAAAAASAPAAAQSARVRDASPATRVSLVSDATPRPVVVIRLNTWRSSDLPTEVTIADSASQFVASFRASGDTRSHPMYVDVVDHDVLLQAETPRGIVTLYLPDIRSDGGAGTISGHWWLDGQDGDLRGRVVH